MEVFRINDFGGNGVARIAVAQVLFDRGIFRVDIAPLYHKLFDYAMEQQAVVTLFFHIFDKIIPV